MNCKSTLKDYATEQTDTHLLFTAQIDYEASIAHNDSGYHKSGHLPLQQSDYSTSNGSTTETVTEFQKQGYKAMFGCCWPVIVSLLTVIPMIMVIALILRASQSWKRKVFSVQKKDISSNGVESLAVPTLSLTSSYIPVANLEDDYPVTMSVTNNPNGSTFHHHANSPLFIIRQQCQ